MAATPDTKTEEVKTPDATREPDAAPVQVVPLTPEEQVKERARIELLAQQAAEEAAEEQAAATGKALATPQATIPRPLVESDGKQYRVLHSRVDTYARGAIITNDQLGVRGARLDRLLALGAIEEYQEPKEAKGKPKPASSEE